MTSLPLKIILSLPLPARAAAPALAAPRAPISVIASPSASVISPLIALTPSMPSALSLPMPSPSIAMPSLTPTALQAAPLLAAAVDAKVPVEAAAEGGEKLTALLQGADPLSRVKVAEVVPGVLHMAFPSQRLMSTTMVRFQEHYESPKYRGKVFTRAEFDAWYSSRKDRPGDTSYYKYWDGFNIPSRVLRRFKKGDFDPLDPKERALLARFAAREGRFYMIATAGKDGDPTVLRHEVAHGLWYTRPAYRRRAQALLRTVNLKPVFKMLERLGYHPSVWLDEAHAWIGDGAKALRANGADPKPYAVLRKRLLALQKEYVSGVF